MVSLIYLVVVLIDDGSASASEIVAAAVSESADIPLIGVKSFGKGTVQSAQNFKDGSNLKFTAFKWLTPKEIGFIKKVFYQILKRSCLIMRIYHSFLADDKWKESDTSTEVKTAEEMFEAIRV